MPGHRGIRIVNRARTSSGILRRTRNPARTEPNTQRVFKFGSQRKPSTRVMTIRVLYATGRTMVLNIDVVDVNVPLLFELDTLDNHKMYINNVEDVLVCTEPSYEHPITWKFGHLFYEWEDVLYTDNELKRIDRHIYHAHPDKVSNLMKRAEDPNANKETYDQLESITANCDICQRLASQPGRFRVSLPSEVIVFNRTILMDIMSHSSKPVLHVICKDTLFSAAIFVSGSSSINLWNEYMKMWVNPYIGHPRTIHADYGPQRNGRLIARFRIWSYRLQEWKVTMRLASANGIMTIYAKFIVEFSWSIEIWS